MFGLLANHLVDDMDMDNNIDVGGGAEEDGREKKKRIVGRQRLEGGQVVILR
jgi:hypothetical protein